MTWPITEPDFGSYRFFCREVAIYLGKNPDWNDWNAETEGLITRIVQQGVMNYYYPPVVDGYQHEWTFMRPTASITTAAKQAAYDLPEDFERFDGDLTYDPDKGYGPIRITSEGEIRTLAQQTDYTSTPNRAAARPKGSTGLAAQREEVLLHPTPDSTYKLSFRYHALPRQLGDTYTFPLGGPAHAEGIAASCVAAAELKKTGGEGPMATHFKGRLGAMISQDLRRAPRHLGYSGDPHSASRSRAEARAWLTQESVTYEGTSYSG